MVQGPVTNIGGMELKVFGKRCQQVAFELAKAVCTAEPDTDIWPVFVELARKYLPPKVGLYGGKDTPRRPSTLGSGPSVIVTFDRTEAARFIQAECEAGDGEAAVTVGVQVNGAEAAVYMCGVGGLAMHLRSLYEDDVWQIVDESSEPQLVDLLPRAATLRGGVLLCHGSPPVDNPLVKGLIRSAHWNTEDSNASFGLAVARVLSGDGVDALLCRGSDFASPVGMPLRAFFGVGIAVWEITKVGLVETTAPSSDSILLCVQKLHVDDLTRYRKVHALRM